MNYFNEVTHNNIRKALDKQGFSFEEFEITEIDSGYVENEMELGISFDYSDEIGIKIQFKIIKNYFFILIENSESTRDYSVEYIYSPGSIKNLERDNYKYFQFNNITSNINKWLTNFNDVISEKVLDKYEEAVSKVIEDVYENTPDEALSDNEIENLKNTIANLEIEMTKKFEELIEESIENKEQISILNQELEDTKVELQSIIENATKMDRKSWTVKTKLTLNKIVRKFPNSTVYLASSTLLKDLPIEQKMLGLGVSVISDLSKSDVNSKDILDMQ